MSGIIGVSPDMRSGVLGKYPAGHVLQTVSSQSTGTSVYTSSTDFAAAGFPIEMTAKSKNGNYLCTFHSPRADTAYAAAKIEVTLFKSENLESYVETPNLSGRDRALILEMPEENNYAGTLNFTYMYPSSISSGQSIKFQVYYKREGGTTGSNVYLVTASQFSFIVQEIQA